MTDPPCARDAPGREQLQHAPAAHTFSRRELRDREERRWSVPGTNIIVEDADGRQHFQF
jgi:hypothetical protein